MIVNGEYFEYLLIEALEELKIQINKRLEPILVKEDVVDQIDKKRAKRRWEKSFGYYCLHPEKFMFGFRDF
ncbi:MAG: hypothetical protein ACFFE4_09200 [Candidatus Thorarchaeota archaeon]